MNASGLLLPRGESRTLRIGTPAGKERLSGTSRRGYGEAARVLSEGVGGSGCDRSEQQQNEQPFAWSRLRLFAEAREFERDTRHAAPNRLRLWSLRMGQNRALVRFHAAPRRRR